MNATSLPSKHQSANARAKLSPALPPARRSSRTEPSGRSSDATWTAASETEHRPPVGRTALVPKNMARPPYSSTAAWSAVKLGTASLDYHPPPRAHGRSDAVTPEASTTCRTDLGGSAAATVNGCSRGKHRQRRSGAYIHHVLGNQTPSGSAAVGRGLRFGATGYTLSNNNNTGVSKSDHVQRACSSWTERPRYRQHRRVRQPGSVWADSPAAPSRSTGPSQTPGIVRHNGGNARLRRRRKAAAGGKFFSRDRQLWLLQRPLIWTPPRRFRRGERVDFGSDAPVMGAAYNEMA